MDKLKTEWSCACKDEDVERLIAFCDAVGYPVHEDFREDACMKDRNIVIHIEVGVYCVIRYYSTGRNLHFNSVTDLINWYFA